MKNIFILFFFLPLLTFAQIPYEEVVEAAFQDRTEVYFSFKADTKSQVNSLSKIVSIDHRSNTNEVRAYANKKQFADFLALEIPYTLLKSAGEKKTKPKMKGLCKKKAPIAGIITQPMLGTTVSCTAFRIATLPFVKSTILVRFPLAGSC